jgi:methylmalonyl-CoA mutase C-terminal domain/subunit
MSPSSEHGNERTSPIRVLIAKPGLDGHDVGAKLVCRALMDAGMEVIYTGLRQSPEAIAQAALQEGVDAVGLSILSGAHASLCRKVAQALAARGLSDVLLLAGGNIPRPDFAELAQLGVHGVFPTGTPFETIVSFLRDKVRP